MITGFHRTHLNDNWAFVRGPARLLINDITAPFPGRISNVIWVSNTNIDTGAKIYDARNGWIDLGATKGGIQVSTNTGGESWTIDPNTGHLASDPTSWSAAVTTQLAEPTFNSLRVAWETSDIEAGADDNEEVVSYGQTHKITPRRLAILYRDDTTELIRAIIFRRAQIDYGESGFLYNKTGEQQTIAIKFKAIPDRTMLETKKRFFTIFQQITTTESDVIVPPPPPPPPPDSNNNLLLESGDALLQEDGSEILLEV